MDRKQVIIEKIREQGILPLFYADDKDVCLEVTKTLYDAGIRVIEFTNRGQGALDNFKALVDARNKSLKDLVLAVGTIRTSEQAMRFIDAGADFLISPMFDADVCDAAYITKTLWVPGCMTPTEIHLADEAGCKLIKLFPGNVLGPSFVSGIKELFPTIDFMPTGGVDVNNENIAEWFKAGVCAVGLGSKLISKDSLMNKDYSKIGQLTTEALSIVKAIRK